MLLTPNNRTIFLNQIFYEQDYCALISFMLCFSKSIQAFSQEYKDQFSNVVDGWNVSSAGGNFYYGLQAGVSFRKYDISLRGGKIITQDFKTSPLLPLYGQLGINLNFLKV